MPRVSINLVSLLFIKVLQFMMAIYSHVKQLRINMGWQTHLFRELFWKRMSTSERATASFPLGPRTRALGRTHGDHPKIVSGSPHAQAGRKRVGCSVQIVACFIFDPNSKLCDFAFGKIGFLESGK